MYFLRKTAQELIDDLRHRRPADMRPYVKDKDLIRLVESVDGVTCEYDEHFRQKVFVGIGKLLPIQDERDGDSYGDKFVSSADYRRN